MVVSLRRVSLFRTILSGARGRALALPIASGGGPHGPPDDDDDEGDDEDEGDSENDEEEETSRDRRAARRRSSRNRHASSADRPRISRKEAEKVTVLAWPKVTQLDNWKMSLTMTSGK